MIIELDEEQIASYVLNHRYPDHNVKMMVERAMVAVSTYPDGSFISLRVEVNDEVIEAAKPEFPC
ncbi:hypothetical protein LCGC14_2583770 [marine sediment metagenome]|uniref:Uncharacterized protein n=1 Tax=marine sediment metagenome TaxID=412755 RepID=A0A0F9CPR8_9ZZZZ